MQISWKIAKISKNFGFASLCPTTAAELKTVWVIWLWGRDKHTSGRQVYTPKPTVVTVMDGNTRPISPFTHTEK